MKKYVFTSLERYGNTSISMKTFNQLGEARILADLRAQGFECRIELIKRINDTEGFHHRRKWESVVIWRVANERNMEAR